jgi:TolB-like protein/class 3 adenylate cyclase/predicted Zn-dependent protease
MPEGPPEEKPPGTRKLAAIVFTDIVAFSRQMGESEPRTVRLLARHNQIIEQAVAAHHGKVIKTIGDGFLIEFSSVVHAVQCAQQIQAQFRAYNAEQEKDEQIHVRIGIHLGDILVQPNGDVLGDGVNIAARLQALAEPDTICISDVVYRDVAKKIPLGTVLSRGRPQLKNIALRFSVYGLLTEPPRGIRQRLNVQWLQLQRRVGTTLLPRPVLVLVSVLLLGGFVTLWYLSRPLPNTQHLAPSTQAAPAALPLPAKPSLIVLPLTNMSGDPEQEYFSDGLTEVLTSDLSRISSLFVIARNTAFTYKGKATNVQDIGKELGVRYVLEGSVQKAGERVRIVAQLVDTTTGGHIWSQRYDRPLKDIFALQDEIVQKIVTTLRLQLTLLERGALVRKTTENLEAYDSYLRGLEYYLRYTQETHAQARQMFEKAITLDPQYAEAYALLSMTYGREWGWGWSTDPQTLERALAMAQRAVVLDDSLSRAHGALSLVLQMKRQSDQAIAEGERTIALDPNNADSYARQAGVLNLTGGRPEEALGLVEKAMRLNPRYPPWYLNELGTAYRRMGRYAEAIAAQQQVLLRTPDYPLAHVNLTASYLWQWAFQLGQEPQTLEQVLEAAQRAVALHDSLWAAHMNLGYVYLWQKQYEQALAEMERAIALDSNEAWSYAALAETLSRVGKPEEALRMVEQALRRKSLVADQHLISIGTAYALAGRPEEAIAPLKQFLSRYPNILGAHLTLAAVYSELGREAEARAEGTEVLRINPKFSLEVHKERVPIKDPAMLERHIAALRKVGLQ